MPPRLASTVPDVLPYNATETKLPVAAIHTGHVLRKTVQGATPPIHNNSISKPNATDAETTSRVKNIGMHRINAPMKRLTGLIFATNHDGDAGFVSLRRSLCGTTVMVSSFSLPSRPLFLLVSSMSLPLSDQNTACAQRFDERLIVRNHDDRATLVARTGDQLDHAGPRGEILSECRLVHDQHFWRGSQHGRHGQSSFLTAR